MSPGAVMVVAVGAMVVLMTVGVGAVMWSGAEVNVRSEVVSSDGENPVGMTERR
jgi:hypothetical protein